MYVQRTLIARKEEIFCRTESPQSVHRASQHMFSNQSRWGARFAPTKPSAGQVYQQTRGGGRFVPTNPLRTTQGLRVVTSPTYPKTKRDRPDRVFLECGQLFSLGGYENRPKALRVRVVCGLLGIFPRQSRSRRESSGVLCPHDFATVFLDTAIRIAVV